MAAGRLDVPRRRDYYGYSKKDYDRCKDVAYSVGGFDRNFGFGRSGFSCRDEVREMWSGNGLDKSPMFEDGEISEYQVQMPPENKRKFSPIIWDVEGKKAKASSKETAAPSSGSPHGGCDRRICALDGGNASHMGGLESPFHKDCVQGSVDAIASKSPTSLFPSLPHNNYGGEDQEPVQVEEEFAEARSISMSRWAYDGDSPREATVSCDEDLPGERFKRKKSSPKKEADRSQSFGSDERDCSINSGGRYVDRGNEMDDGDVVNIDELQSENAGVYLMESNDVFCQIEEPTAATKSSVNMLQGCRSIYEYEYLNEINEGTYGKVYRARDKLSGKIVALKKVKMDVGKDKNLEEYGFPLSSLREINILLSSHHPSIVNVKEVAMGDLDSVFVVMEYFDHDLKGLMQVMKQPFSTSEVKCLVLQLLKGVKYLHDNWVLHRDLKTSNLLLNNQGELKICDFGMSRQYGSPLKPYTSLVVTLWYRAPELLLGATQYSTAIDMWSVGCIMAELLAKEPLFKGKSEIDQLDKIFRTLGTPNEKIWPGLSKLPGAKANFVKQPYNVLRKKFPATSFTGSPVLSDLGLDLLNKLLTYDPEKRITADAALNHAWFQEVPLPKSKEFMPTYPPQHVKNR